MRSSRRLLANCRLLVVGGGSSGLGIASKMARRLPKGSVTLIDSIQTHYYQPGFTLVSAGAMTLEQNRRKQKDLIPTGVKWLEQRVKAFQPQANAVTTEDGSTIEYDYMVLCTGMEIRLDMVEGLAESVKDESCPVSTIYLPHFAEKTNRLLNTIEKGNFLFTFPSTPIKCAGAPQKVCYIADDILRTRGVRSACSLHYYTTLPRIFGVEKYANALMKVVKERDINLHTRHALKKVDGKNRIATFENLDNSSTVEAEFDFLHAGPPCSPVSVLRNTPSLTDANGWVDVSCQTLQSTKFSNVFALGDCTNTPNAKTAAAISSQLKTVEKNLSDAIDGKPFSSQYDGYASCPLVLGASGKRAQVILAEFGPNGPMESFPFNQSKPSYFSFWLKRYFMPFLYWHGLIKGYWNGPSLFRRIVAPLKKNQK
ncbi:hypothetical protein PMAYCL1PPCAC_03870 [Pristionchus mayeri]|uniref:Sulfide:quinone oxidoreductase, mitochondrial n=1 Tax=Pristionchus mayeri TaxID=1317129 RepID=A0AAN4ZAZ2_9BILA|nr:hypothetical protein PMAYCL1PPCAC_03870 [Pristionchus mayeri]